MTGSMSGDDFCFMNWQAIISPMLEDWTAFFNLYCTFTSLYLNPLK